MVKPERPSLPFRPNRSIVPHGTNQSTNVPLGTNRDATAQHPATRSVRQLPSGATRKASVPRLLPLDQPITDGDERDFSWDEDIDLREDVDQAPPNRNAPTMRAVPPSSKGGDAVAAQGQRLLDDCLAAASSVVAATLHRENKIVAALERTMRLYEHFEQHPEYAKRTLDKNAIRVTATTKNPFTPIVKLVFGSEESSTVSRYAGCLRYVADNPDEDSSFADIVGQGGGIVGCYKEDARINRGPARQRAVEKRASDLQNLRLSSIPFANKVVGGQFERQFTAVLIERSDDGSLMIIGTRSETDPLAVSRYKPLSGKPSK